MRSRARSVSAFLLLVLSFTAMAVPADFPYVPCPYFCVNYSNENAECNAEGTIKRKSNMSSCRVVEQCMTTDMGEMCNAFCEGARCYDV